MRLLEYSKRRAEAMLCIDFSKIKLPFHIHWMEVVNLNELLKTIYIGNHSHSFYEFHFVFSGSTTYIIGGQELTFHSGEALIIPPNVTHKYLQNSDSFIKLSLALSIDEEYLLNSDNYKKFKFDDIIYKNTDFILKETENITVFSAAVMGGKIAEILESSLKSLCFPINSKENSRDSRINTALSFIEKNNCHSIKSEDVSKECCLSIKHLNRLFKNELNMSVHDYIINSKVFFAQKLIKNTDYSFKEIAFKLGFPGESNFTTFIKKHTGFTPSEYRKN